MYCGGYAARGRHVCTGHSDLPALDPRLNRDLHTPQRPRPTDVLKRLVEAKTR